MIGMAWPAIGANVMRRIALAGSGHGRNRRFWDAGAGRVKA